MVRGGGERDAGRAVKNDAGDSGYFRRPGEEQQRM